SDTRLRDIAGNPAAPRPGPPRRRSSAPYHRCTRRPGPARRHSQQAASRYPLLPLLFRQHEVLRDAVAEGPVLANVLGERNGDVLRPHLRLAREQPGRLGVERLLLRGRAAGAEKYVDQHDTVAAPYLQVIRIVDEPPRRVLGDDLEVVALR